MGIGHASGARGWAIRRALAAIAVIMIVAGTGTHGRWAGNLAAAAQAERQEQPASLIPSGIEISATTKAAINADFLTEDERRDLRIRHGVWTDEDLNTAERRAEAALAAWRLEDSVFADGQGVSGESRAEYLLRVGELPEAMAALEGISSVRSSRLRGECLEWLGRFGEADEAIEPVISAYTEGKLSKAAELVEVARCLSLRARLKGEPGSVFQAIMNALGEVSQRLDRLNPTARLLEGMILYEKDNTEEAINALHEALALNPRCSEAWYLLGHVALDVFDFTSAEAAVMALRGINPDHPLSTLLAARTALVQNMPMEAHRVLEPLLAARPTMREAMALRAAAEAIRYDEDRMNSALSAFEAISPGSAYAHAVAGKYLSQNRQYDLAAEILQEAIRRQPGWAGPQIELGLMLVQAARDDEAREVLRRVTELDPFNTASRFSLTLLNEISGYEVIESPNFEVRYDPKTTDGLLAAEMVEPLEKIFSDVTSAFGHEPATKTVIELQPNHARFAVRITGMPDIHTIAACTGPLIAMESPRRGTGHFGVYDWARVVRHEYVHTVTLSQTKNRIPHWFTEAAAVWQEVSPRAESTCMMLAQAYAARRLFDLDEINWAFVRPRGPNDRSKAYAQGHWMFEFLVERYGADRMQKLMETYSKGWSEEVAMPEALGVTRGVFYDEFLTWAGPQVESWGFGAKPTMEELISEATGEEGPAPPGGLTLEQVDVLLARYPAHPDLLEARILMMHAEKGYTPEMIPWLKRYLEARPVATMPHEALAQIYLNEGEGSQAIPHLEALDLREQYRPLYAVELAQQYRLLGRYQEAQERMERALGIDPFNAAFREDAAAIAIQAGDLGAARRHIVALTRIEPDRPVHQRRLEALDAMEAKIHGGGGG